MTYEARVLGAVAVALSTVAAPAMAQTGGTGVEQQSMARMGAVDRTMLGMPVMRSDGALVGWLTGAKMPNSQGVALIERPPVDDDTIEVFAINEDALSVRGNTLVIGEQLTARPAEYGVEGPTID